MHLTTKLPHVGTTIFTEMNQLAAAHGALNLGQGFPDFEGPQLLRDALTEAMASGRNQYAPMAGLPALLEQIAIKVAGLYGRATDPATEITVTSGGTDALFTAIAAVVRPGEEVVVLDPCYDCYDPAIDLQGARAVHVPLDPKDFSVDWERVKKALTPRTRMLILNSPNNPSGAMLSEQDLDTLAALIRDMEILVLSDEVYEHITFDGREHRSVSGHPELAARAFVVSSFGKTYHCTGWKVGYCVAPPALTAEFRKVHQYLTFCTFHPAQWAFAQVMERDPAHHLGLGRFYQEKRDRFADLLAESRFRLLPVAGGYFQLADYSAISEQGDRTFCEWLVKEAGVAGIPVSAFYETPPEARLIRFCFAKNEDTMVAAAARLSSL
jgi:methionine aminotransferase